jgi:hypothetical protein
MCKFQKIAITNTCKPFFKSFHLSDTRRSIRECTWWHATSAPGRLHSVKNEEETEAGFEQLEFAPRGELCIL